MSVGQAGTGQRRATALRPLATRQRSPVDVVAAQEAATALLGALGWDLNDPSLAETPSRMARALMEMTHGADFDLTTFPNNEGYNELVMVRDIRMQSLCEHHVLPFVGVAHIGYVPDDRILGLSKFARMVQLHASRPQSQERLTQRVAEHLQEALTPRGVGVVIEAEHTCMSLRGAHSPGARTTTTAMRGLLREDPRNRAEFLALARGGDR